MRWLTPRPGRFTPRKETRYPLYRRLGGPQGRSWRVRKISPPPGFDPRSVQAVANRYTDWAIAAHDWVLYLTCFRHVTFCMFVTDSWNVNHTMEGVRTFGFMTRRCHVCPDHESSVTPLATHTKHRSRSSLNYVVPACGGYGGHVYSFSHIARRCQSYK